MLLAGGEIVNGVSAVLLLPARLVPSGTADQSSPVESGVGCTGQDSAGFCRPGDTPSGSSSSTMCRASPGFAATSVVATAAPNECPSNTSTVPLLISASTAAAATCGVSGARAAGLLPWLGRSKAVTVLSDSARRGPTCHQVQEEEVEPCSSTTVQGPVPHTRLRSPLLIGRSWPSR
jgi:hypothetical protein